MTHLPTTPSLAPGFPLPLTGTVVGTHRGTEVGDMGLDDKLGHKAEELKGKAKQEYGERTDQPGMEAEGRTEQASGSLKQAGDKVKDAFKD